MAIVDFWKANKAEFSQKQLKQVIAIAGEGTLKDGSTASAELREFLKQIHQNQLGDYAYQCLDSSFEGSGFALQDIVNEIGRRLGFEVSDGRYRGQRAFQAKMGSGV